MAQVGFKPEKLKKTRPTEYLTRFLFGCALTLVFSLTTKWAGPVIGGLFLAFPGIYPPGSSFVEKKEEERKQEAGLHGTERARTLASAHAVGASAGSFGLLAFAAILWLGLPRYGLLWPLVTATLLWLLVSCTAWWLRERM